MPLPVAVPNELIPWQVREEHRWNYPIMMLRTEARRRAGDDNHLTRLMAWLEQMNRDQTVVHYAPDTDEAFVYTPKRDGIDNDLVRVPEAESLPPV